MFDFKLTIIDIRNCQHLLSMYTVRGILFASGKVGVKAQFDEFFLISVMLSFYANLTQCE